MIEQCKQCLDKSILRLYALPNRYIVKVKGVYEFVDLSGILNDLLSILKAHDCYLHGMIIVAQDVHQPVVLFRADEDTEIIKDCYEVCQTRPGVNSPTAIKDQTRVCIQLFNEDVEMEDEAFLPKSALTPYQVHILETLYKSPSYGSIVFLWLQESEFARSVAETWKVNMGFEDKELIGSLYKTRQPHDPNAAYVIFKGQCKFV